jgi:hypothetical protein
VAILKPLSSGMVIGSGGPIGAEGPIIMTGGALGALIAHGFATIVMKRSIMTEKIARRGYHIYREYGVDPLERHHVDEVMSRTVETIDGDLSVREALAMYFGTTQAHRAYPTCCASAPPLLHCPVKPAGSSQRGSRCTVSSGCPWSRTPKRCD